MTVIETQFYHTSGTLRPDAPSYVARQADIDLHHGLTNGEFCYVLTSRQMGKSSLMARTAANLRREGIAVVPLDLTGVGQNLSPEQWYDGLLAQMGAALDVEDDLDDFWADRARLGPLQRWMAALRQVVLARVPGHVVVFVDEIDAVRSLPFSTDEFFAGIRECYNRRSDDPEYGRLTFCLLGVASPSDLIRDTRTTPFNIGRRIELNDFTEEEAGPLAMGLLEEMGSQERRERRARSLLQRILYWTGGHPYLTQRLCQAVAASGNVTTINGVDELCRELFLSHRARERDDNLLFVRDRLLYSEEDRARMLSLYGRVRNSRQKVPDDETNPLVTRLHLSGVVREHEGNLRVRNRIYARVFNTAWVTVSMPDAELRRLRSVAREEAKKRRLAEERERAGRRNLYAAQIGLAHQAIATANLPRALELLAEHRPEPGQEELRGFEWGYLWRQANRDDSHRTLGRHLWVVFAVTFSPDGQTLASTSADGTLRLWEVATGRELAVLPGRAGPVAFAPDGSLLAWGDEDRLRLWDRASGRTVGILDGHRSVVESLAFSPDGQTLASGDREGTARLWQADTRELVTVLQGRRSGFRCLTFSPDGSNLLSCGGDAAVRAWDLAAGQERTILDGESEIAHIAFSPDGGTLALADAYAGMVRLWDVAREHLLAVLPGHEGGGVSLAFSPDGSILATAGADARIKLWSTKSRQELATLVGHQRTITAVAFSPDGESLATGSWDHTIKLWSTSPKTGDVLQGSQTGIGRLAIAADGSRLAAAGLDGSFAVWDLKTEREMIVLQAHEGWTDEIAISFDGSVVATTGHQDRTLRVWGVTARSQMAILPRKGRSANHPVALSPDGRLMAYGSDENQIRLWDVAARQDVGTLEGHTGHIVSLAFSPKGKIVASGSGPPDGTVRLWDHTIDCEIGCIAASRSWVGPVAFSPDGKRLAAAVGAPEYTIKVWDTTSRRELATLRRHAGQIGWIGFSPDGRSLASLSPDDTTLKLWSTSSWTEVMTVRDPKLALGAEFTPDGRALIAARQDGTLRLWRATTLAEAEPQVRRLWLDHRAEAARSARQWPDALRRLDRLVATDPKDELLRFRRAEARAELGQWRKAAADLAAALERSPTGWGDCGLLLALAQLADGDRSDYRKTCRSLLEWGESNLQLRPFDGMSIVRACVLAPDAVADPERVVRLARELQAMVPERADLLGLLGQALYRAGRAEEAGEHLSRSAAGRSREDAVEHWFFVSMARQASGDPDAARHAFATAVGILEERMPSGSAIPAASPVPWQRRLTWQLLRREAEALLSGSVEPQRFHAPHYRTLDPAETSIW